MKKKEQRGRSKEKSELKNEKANGKTGYCARDETRAYA